MEYKIIIPGRLPALNEYTKANRGNKYAANKMKQDCERDIYFCIMKYMIGVKIKKPVFLSYAWYEKDRKRDHDNVAFGQKFVQDSLVKAGALEGDGWKHITGFSHRFEVDKESPRVEIILTEVE